MPLLLSIDPTISREPTEPQETYQLSVQHLKRHSACYYAIEMPSTPQSIPAISFLDLPREIRQKILKQTFNLQLESTPRQPTPLYSEECMNSRWNPIKEMRSVEDWMKVKNRIGKWRDNLASVDALVEEDMQWVANEWYEELSDVFEMLKFENLRTNSSTRPNTS
ncbi:hypothetical protein FKW77_002454 [Venturia effusa]|uniref:Uncharacterized protein n=1 Tax=Venturia effusa TaxID=50376 RepID=A0A517LC69_9PEZI|nr:hypothetical protein FKW77_002454 [Venturia effusa]